MAGQEPALAQKDPKAYYLWLQTQGLSPLQAVQQVQQRFGPPKTPDQQQKEAADKAQGNALAQAGGVVGGAIAGRFIYNKIDGWVDKLTGAKVGEETVKQVAEQTGQSLSTTAQTATGATQGTTSGIDAFSKNFTPVNPGSLPAGQSVPEGMTAIRSNIDGTVQVVPTESLANESFLGSVDWDRVGQGGLGLLQLYGAYKAYQGGDKIGAGLSGASGAANLATAAGADLGANLVPGLNIATGLYTGYKTADALGDMAAGSQRTKAGIAGGASSGAAIGAGVGSLVPGVGTLIGAGVGAAIGATVGAVGSWTGSKKGKAQFMRDNIRGVLQENGVLDQDFKGTLADGSQYDFGKDGSTLKWKEIDKIAAKQPAAWNAAVPLTDALATAYGFVGQKASDISAWYAKGAVSNAGDDVATAIKNAQHFAQQQGITFEQIKAKLDEAMKDNRINQSQYDYYLGGARQLTAGIKAGPQTRPPAPMGPPQQMPQQPQQEEGKKKSIREVLQQNMGKK
jgi:hypothetical protein